MEESPQGEKHLASLVWQGPAAACQSGSSGLWLASALFICYLAHLPLLCQMSGFCASCFFWIPHHLALAFKAFSLSLESLSKSHPIPGIKSLVGKQPQKAG